MFKNFISRSGANLPDVLLAGGGIAIAVGAGMVYPPAGFIVGGMISMAAGWLIARGAS
jgi:hypothetical protein